MEFKPAKLDTLAWITSIITSIILFGFSFFFLVNRIPYGLILALLLFSIILVSYLLSPKTYYIQGGYFIIEKVIGTKISMPMNEIEGIFEIEDFYKLKPVRLMANGGLFGYYGIYNTKDYGNINCQLTRLKKILIIKSKNGYYAISPEKPDPIFEWFGSMHIPTSIKEIPESLKKKANPLILLIPGTIFALTLIMIILLYSLLPDKIAIHFDARGNPDQWAFKISFLYFGILPQVGSLIACVISFFVMRNRFNEPTVLYFLISIISVIQLIVAYISFDIYWFNLHKSHLIPMDFMFFFFSGLVLLFLLIYYRALTKKEKSKQQFLKNF